MRVLGIDCGGEYTGYGVVEQDDQGALHQCRGGFGGPHQSRFKAAAGALAVLFGRSYERAEGIHQAMLSRGFDGQFRLLSAGRITAADIAFLAMAVMVPVALRLGGKL